MTKKYVHTVRVLGKFRFPIDMLRYDGLCPSKEEDSSEISGSLGDDEWETAPIELNCIAPKNWKPTEARWKSFGWNILSHVIG